MALLPRFLVVTALSGVAVATAPAPVDAQQAPGTNRAQVRVVSQRGWVGVSVSIEPLRGAGGVLTTSVTVTDVSEGSPAARAGIRAGDVILSINGAQSFPEDIRAGDKLHVMLERAGRTRSVDVTAVARPIETETVPVWTFTIRADSMVDRMYQAMDSLRVRLVRDQDGIAVLDVSGRPRGDALPALIRRIPDGLFSIGEIQPPFGYSIFGGQANDSLRQEMDTLNEHIRNLRSQQAARLRQLTSAANGDPRQIDRSDPELRRIDLAMVDADRRSAELRDAMDRVVWREAMSGGVVVRRLPADAATNEPGGAWANEPGDAWAGFRPLDPYLLGQNRAAGAEVVDLRPELAEYFGVDGGVLVVDVAARTPAALAGIQPGDVLTDVGRTPVRSIQGLRAGLSVPDAEIPVVVIRKGQRVQLLLKR